MKRYTISAVAVNLSITGNELWSLVTLGNHLRFPTFM